MSSQSDEQGVDFVTVKEMFLADTNSGIRSTRDADRGMCASMTTTVQRCREVLRRTPFSSNSVRLCQPGTSPRPSSGIVIINEDATPAHSSICTVPNRTCS
jgi:hypothetical protein